MKLFAEFPESKRRFLLFLALLNFASAVSFQGWAMLYNNFAVEAAGLDASLVGLIQGLREIPGFLGFTLVFFLFILSEHRMAALCVAAAGLGTMLTGMFPSFVPLVCTTMLMSVGFHYFEAISNSLAIQHFDLKQTPLVMSRLRSLTACGSLLISVFVFTCSGALDFRWLFMVPGLTGLAIGLFFLVADPMGASRAPVQRRSVKPQARYWLFYVLNLLMGGRRIIFSVFAVFLMVEQFGFSVRTISLLFMFNYAVNWVFNPLVGRIINRLGERRLLTIEYVSALVIFLGYAYCRNEALIVLLYVFDSLTFNFAIAVRTFFQKIARPADAAPNMAIAQTINHISAVSIPAVGGWIWQTFGYSDVFLFGAALTVCSISLAQLIDREIACRGTQREE